MTGNALADTTQEVVDAYVAGVEKMIADPDYQAAAADFFGDYPTLTGPEAQELWVAGNTIAPETREWLLTWLGKTLDYQP